VLDIAVGGFSRGVVYVLRMASGGTVSSFAQVLLPNDQSPVNGDAFGSAVAACGDINGDGVVDLLVGAPASLAAASSVSVGRVFAVLKLCRRRVEWQLLPCYIPWRSFRICAM
jgi:FG-GAP repeat